MTSLQNLISIRVRPPINCVSAAPPKAYWCKPISGWHKGLGACFDFPVAFCGWPGLYVGTPSIPDIISQQHGGPGGLFHYLQDLR